MASRLIALIALAALLAASRPAIADDHGLVGPVAPLAAAPAGGGSVGQRIGLVLTIIGGICALASAFLVVRGYQHRNDLNGDASIADTGYGLVIGVPSLLAAVVGVALLVPNDAGSDPNPPKVNPRFVELPRGLALRFVF
ncbi:MAG TPA: hypothetical protein VHH90_06910 [Polyangia bacterium]|nr:hypothetical protein [Polyangia bacterium]